LIDEGDAVAPVIFRVTGPSAPAVLTTTRGSTTNPKMITNFHIVGIRLSESFIAALSSPSTIHYENKFEQSLDAQPSFLLRRNPGPYGLQEK